MIIFELCKRIYLLKNISEFHDTREQEIQQRHFLRIALNSSFDILAYKDTNRHNKLSSGMNLDLLSESIKKYKNSSQITRVLTEEWLLNNFYCPGCEQPYLHKFKNNQPAADFYCTSCREEFKLKSKKTSSAKR